MKIVLPSTVHFYFSVDSKKYWNMLRFRMRGHWNEMYLNWSLDLFSALVSIITYSVGVVFFCLQHFQLSSLVLLLFAPTERNLQGVLTIHAATCMCLSTSAYVCQKCQFQHFSWRRLELKEQKLQWDWQHTHSLPSASSLHFCYSILFLSPLHPPPIPSNYCLSFLPSLTSPFFDSRLLFFFLLSLVTHTLCCHLILITVSLSWYSIDGSNKPAHINTN